MTPDTFTTLRFGKSTALHSVTHYKRALYLLGDLRFVDAAASFKASMQIYVDVGRRSMVPFSATYALLAYKFAASLTGPDGPKYVREGGNTHVLLTSRITS